MRATRLTFDGHIAGFGTGVGVRVVVGAWSRSPFGGFTDVMLQTPDDRRLLLAPTAEVAEFVASSYHFDDVVVAPVAAQRSADTLAVTSPTLEFVATIGGPAPIDRLLRLVPARLAGAPWWLRAIEPVAARILPGVHTAGTAGNGRREYYGVRRSRLVTAISGQFDGTDLGGLARLEPPVQFGFASAPATPQIVAVTTRIDLPAAG
ncbi:hypothetical protein [Mycobacterium sp.]|uniref:hypothetical protein n=1 Tax=Mycobacterium sp. TaxID=1785 RepID=UPI0031DB3E97